jgi:hypothetical protein
LVKIHPLKHSNQPVISSFHRYQTCNGSKKKRKKIEKEKVNPTNNDNNNNNIDKYENIFNDKIDDEDCDTNLLDFSNTFSHYFN